MTTELCTYTRNACDIARRTGVERIELCAAPLEGGTTPSAGLIRYARSLPGLRLSLSKIGEANILCARTRPKLIGGERAKYTEED